MDENPFLALPVRGRCWVCGHPRRAQFEEAWARGVRTQSILRALAAMGEPFPTYSRFVSHFSKGHHLAVEDD